MSGKPGLKKVQGRAEKTGGEILLTNGIVTRTLSVSGGLRTTLLKFGPDGRNLVHPRHKLGMHGEIEEMTSPCREVTIGVDGTDYSVGLGEGFAYRDYSVMRGEDNLTAIVELANDTGLTLKVHYQLYDGEPFIIKWMELVNTGDKPVVVTSCKPEVLTMPAEGGHRWHECTRKVYPTSHVANAVQRPFTYWSSDYSPMENQPVIWVDHFSSRPEQYGFAIATNYIRRAFVEGFEVAGKKQPPLPKLPGMVCSAGNPRPGEVFTQFPVGPNVLVRPGENFVSFKTYTTFFEGDYEDGGLAMRHMIRTVAPWTSNLHTKFEHTYWTKKASERIRETGEFDMSPLKHSIDQAAELGFDYWYFTLTMWAQSFGEFLPRPEFPNGAADMRRVSDYAHSKGLKVGIHTPEDYGVDFPDHYLLDEKTGEVRSYDIGAAGDFIGKHPELRCIDLEGGQSRGWVMCGAGGYHEHLLKVKIPFAKSIGVDMIDNDGPYYGDLCYSAEHGHHSPEEAQYHNWRLAVERYAAYHDAGFFVMAPDGTQSLFNGNSGNPTYHTETCTRNDVYEFITDMRVCLYKSTFYNPNTAMYYSVWCDPAVMNGVSVTDDPRLFDYYFASLASYGLMLGMLGLEVYGNESQREIIKRWIDFVRDNRDILAKDVLHLSEPNPRDIDAILHINPEGERCGLLAAFNSSDSTLLRQWPVKKKYLGADPVALSDVWTGEQAGHVAPDDNGNFILSVELEPKSYKILLLTSASAVRRT